jgi:hypothetical protein
MLGHIWALYAECRYAERRYAECLGALKQLLVILGIYKGTEEGI